MQSESQQLLDDTLSLVDVKLEQIRAEKWKRMQKERYLCRAEQKLRMKAINRGAKLSDERERMYRVRVNKWQQECDIEGEIVLLEMAAEARRMIETSFGLMAEKHFALEGKRQEQERQQAMRRDYIDMRRIAVEEIRIAIALQRAKKKQTIIW